MHDFNVKLLSLFREQPVDEDFRRIGMRRIFNDSNHPGTITRRRSFFQRRELLDRQVGHEKPLEGVKAHPKSDGELAFCQRVGQLTLIPADKKILLDELSQVALSFDIPEKRPN